MEATASTLNKHSRTAKREWSSSLVFRRRNNQTKDDAIGGAEEETAYGVLVGELQKQSKFPWILKKAWEGMEHNHVA
jgi:hypothetical protein